MKNKKTTLSKWPYAVVGASIVFLGIGFTLHLLRKPTMEDQGWSIVSKLQAHDSQGLSNLVSENELEAIGVSRDQAAKLIDKFVMPKADYFTANLTKITLAGNEIVFEKSKNDPLYKTPPTMVLPPSDHEHVISLAQLLLASWGIEQSQMLQKGYTFDQYRSYLATQFVQAKSMGFTKTMNWSNHEVNALPSTPFTAPPVQS